VTTADVADYDPFEDDRYEDCRYDDVDPAYDEACSDVRYAWRELTGEAPLEISLPEDAERAAAELLAEGCDVEGDEDGGPELVWKMSPLEALAHVRPRLAGAIRPTRPLQMRTCPRPLTRARAPRTRRARRTARTTRGDPDPPGEHGDLDHLRRAA